MLQVATSTLRPVLARISAAASFERLDAARREEQIGAGFGERLRDRAADAGAAAGHQRDLPGDQVGREAAARRRGASVFIASTKIGDDQARSSARGEAVVGARRAVVAVARIHLDAAAVLVARAALEVGVDRQRRLLDRAHVVEHLAVLAERSRDPRTRRCSRPGSPGQGIVRHGSWIRSPIGFSSGLTRGRMRTTSMRVMRRRSSVGL